MKPERQRCEVYWNLHKDCWSVRYPNGRVFMHAKHVVLKDVQWVVQPAGRTRVRAEGKKNVHAFARGVLIDAHTVRSIKDDTLFLGRAGQAHGRAYYNPYEHDTFMRQWSGLIPLRSSAYALLVTECNEASTPRGRAYYAYGNNPTQEDFDGQVPSQ
jgi:hypothetical protein